MTNYNYSAAENKFYPTFLRSEYERSGSWPADCIDIDDSVFKEFTGKQPNNQMRIPGDNGLPYWGDIPEPAQEDITATAETKKSELKAIADSEIEWRKDAVDVGIATEEEADELAEWKKFRVLLMRVDTAKPDWPPLPKEK